MSVSKKEAFPRPANPLRWVLSPLLLLFSAVFVIPLLETVEEDRLAGTVICAGLIIACLAGVLALWGVPGTGRIVSGIVALGFGGYLVHECFLDFDGDWGWGKSRSQATPINSILGFLVFGLPCLAYTVLGSSMLENKAEEDPEEDEWPDDDEPEDREGRR